MKSSCGKWEHDFAPRESKFWETMLKKNERVGRRPSGDYMVSQLCGRDVERGYAFFERQLWQVCSNASCHRHLGWNGSLSRMHQDNGGSLSARYPPMLWIRVRMPPRDATCESKRRIVFTAMNLPGDITSLIQLKQKSRETQYVSLTRRLSECKTFG